MPPISLSNSALKSLLESNPDMRKAALEFLLERSDEQIATDGVTVIETPKLVHIVDNCFNHNVSDEIVVRDFQGAKIPLSAELVKKVFEKECLQEYYRNNQPNSQTKVACTPHFKKRKLASGLTYCYYIGEPAAISIAKNKALSLGVDSNRIFVQGECMLEVCFQSVLLPVTPPTMVVVEDGHDSD